MTNRNVPRASGPANRWAVAGLMAGIVFFVLSAAIAYFNIANMRASDNAIRKTHTVLNALDDMLSATLDAETGQRGYLLTGREAYLEPYVEGAALARTKLGVLQTTMRGDPVQEDNVEQLERNVEQKLRELDATIRLRRDEGFAAALAAVDSDRGKAAMDAIRAQIASMSREELRKRQSNIDQMAAASNTAVISAVVTSASGIALTIAIFLLMARSMRQRARQQWLQQAQVDLSAAMMGDKSIEDLAAAILAFLADKTGSRAGALFKGEGGSFNRASMLGVAQGADVPVSFALNEGLLGKAAVDGQLIVLNDIPQGYLSIGSALGSDVPRHLVIAPTKADDRVNGVIELGFFEPVDELVLELLEQSSGAIGIALRSARFRTRLQDALEETQRQAGELQAQSEELRVSNEELEEQGNALRETQARLELQQVELEQTNSQLEEQAQALETQRDDLERASAALQLKARELEQASQYKSDFLANMSHELRTPLNSLLILSKLLADNPDERLSDEQVKFARTIYSAGNDLLVLINDILDLSKIEAGHIEIQPAPVLTERLASDMQKVFQPIADERGLALEIERDANCPVTIETDRMRLEQVIKNLLSNALKFTERGSVRLSFSPVGEDRLAIKVADTGIGIAKAQQASIFEAFQQADGTISRKYGGTGLGLSISRELARLLGGKISLESKVGEGSCFTLTIPVIYDAAMVPARQLAPVAAPALPSPAPAPKPRAARPAAAVPSVAADDRAALTEGKQLLLVIEDDATFADIVCELSREMGFQCIVASTAQDAIALAGEYRPHAIVLDIGLPDQSGLTVLDQLKHRDETRHIPIHVISGADQGPTALALGAVGFLGKPARRDELAEVLATLQAKLASRMRRVLIVEDDAVQREAVGQLLKSQDVETVGVGTAADCLERLRSETFDCVVLDLSLPDASGFAVLEELSADEAHAFPPVIVYTGRELTADEEQRLRRYSSSIIIKGAKSPERLLDEVSLFLHQVVADLPPEQRKMIEKARHRDAALEGRRILIVEDDVRNVYSLTSVLEPRGVVTQIARNGQEAITALEAAGEDPEKAIDLVLMDVMMPVMDGLTAARTIRSEAKWAKLPIIMLTAKAMPDDQQNCLDAGANDYMAKPIDVDKLLSLVRVWMPR
ncbi:MAG: histidine kinase [Sphingomonadales bacterium RIFCSPHIGHO2_01_FULL_65_20]|uniref:response regulator n=3 Tax=unclassified Blastomonas TaxID=2626550 RepID=UPI0008C76981|nr:response regulator [Blastomonas sp.]OHC92863.1 MAG: histidine kinase [Sphingomonadales bacterium RIFCSPHIGHO2_01_FULL_65_20]